MFQCSEKCQNEIEVVVVSKEDGSGRQTMQKTRYKKIISQQIEVEFIAKQNSY